MAVYEDRVGRVSHGFSDWLVQGGLFATACVGVIMSIDYASVLDNNFNETVTKLAELDPTDPEFARLNSNYGFWTEELSNFGREDMRLVAESKNPALWGMIGTLSAAFATARHFRG